MKKNFDFDLWGKYEYSIPEEIRKTIIKLFRNGQKIEAAIILEDIAKILEEGRDPIKKYFKSVPHKIL